MKVKSGINSILVRIKVAGAVTRVGLISPERYSYRVRKSVMHRGRWSQTNGWAQWQYS
ncbi:hypothetical protein [Psychrobacillus sp. FSL K6-2843]|uniref:hypothetical protein n=1 Tax=Psychrobacillus sp. FSL K6-2843 TaxID=2921549 RepID=UPI00315AFAE7